MDSIPEELLAEIFSWCDVGPFPKRDPFRPETIPILNVCRSWRRVALSTPSLWHSIKIEAGAAHRNSDFEPNWERFLRLSKHSLLDLDLYIDNSQPLPSRILEETGRIRRISIDTFGRDVDVLQLMNAMDISTHLTSLTLSRGHTFGPGHHKLVQKMKKRKTICLPRLVDLSLFGAYSDKLPYMSLPGLKHLCVYNGSLEFQWIHPLICSASQSLNQILFKRVPVHSMPPAHLITPSVNIPSLACFDLHHSDVTAPAGGDDLWFIQYQTFLIQHVASPFKLRFRGTPLPFFELARSSSAISLGLKLIVHFISPREEEQMAAIENEENIRRFLKGFPKLRELRASLDRHTDTSYGHTIFDDRSVLYRVFQDLMSS